VVTAPENSGYTEYNNHKTDLALNLSFAKDTKLLTGKQGICLFVGWECRCWMQDV
jgi:hypothetical protein